MDNLRFVLIAIALFAGTFAGVSWASRGFPVTAMRVEPVKPDVRTADREDRVKPPQQQGPAAEPVARLELPPHATDPAPRQGVGRDQLALTAIQAAQAYARSPCNGAAKVAFVVAASTYLRAKATDADTLSATDNRANEAIKVAFDTGGIRRDEFPAGTELSIDMASGPRRTVRCINSADLRP